MVSFTRYAREVSGVTLPVPLGGHSALDFCNTAAGWGEDERKEYLHSFDHLVVWTREAGLLDAGVAEVLRGIDAEAELARALRLREALYAVCRAPSAGRAWDVVARGAEHAAGAARLEPGGWVLPAKLGQELPVLAVARVAGDLLASGELELVRACPGRGCGWLFLDRRGRRRWCDMAVCGNRAKARRHAARTRRR